MNDLTPPEGVGHRFRVTPLQRLTKGGKWRTEAMRSHSRPVLYWFTRGQGRFTTQGVIRGFGPHNAILLPPRTMHGFEVLGQASGTAVFFPEDLDLGLPADPLHMRFLDVHLQKELTLQLDNLQAELDRADGATERALVHHAGLLAVWLERQAGCDFSVEAEPAPRAADRLATAFSSLLERDFRHDHSVADYAAALGVTATHLSRSCKAACGRPASELVHDRVHFEARTLLRDTKLPIKNIATMLGFRSAAYFTRAFQTHTGQTPSAFRRNPHV